MEASLRDFLVVAIATLKGTAAEKKLAVAYVEKGSEKMGARVCGIKESTAKTYMQRLYAKNGVQCMAHLLVVAFHNLFGMEGGRARPPSPRPAELPTLPKNVRREPRDEGPVVER